MADETNKVTSVSGYNKMPIWQWILVYVLVGIIIYGLFYSFIIFKNRNSVPVAPTGQEVNLEELKKNETEVNADKVTAEIEFTDEGFVPDTVTVKPGTVITWTNSTSSSANVSSDDHPTHTLYPFLNLGTFAAGATVSATFEEVGTYTYHNHLNPEQTGTVVVEDEEGN